MRFLSATKDNLSNATCSTTKQAPVRADDPASSAFDPPSPLLILHPLLTPSQRPFHCGALFLTQQFPQQEPIPSCLQILHRKRIAQQRSANVLPRDPRSFSQSTKQQGDPIVCEATT